MKNKRNQSAKDKKENLTDKVENESNIYIYSNTLELLDQKSFAELFNLYGCLEAKACITKACCTDNKIDSNTTFSLQTQENPVIESINGRDLNSEKNHFSIANRFNNSEEELVEETKNLNKNTMRSTVNTKNTSFKPFVSKGFNSPFKSPTTINTINLRSKNCSNTKNENINKNNLKETKENFNLVDETGMLSDVFDSNYNEFRKHKRKSSILAETNVKKKLEKELQDSQNEEFVKRPIDLLFCGISKEHNASSNSYGFLKQKEFNSPLKLGVLIDKTNSPTKFNGEVVKGQIVSDQAHSVNPAFFITDDVIENKENCILEEPNEKEITISKDYLKNKQINTKINEEYTTIIPKKKVILGLFQCPVAYFRKSGKERKVYFNFDPVITTHNTQNALNSILIENENPSTSFEWTGEKEVVEIIKKIDLSLY